MYKKDSNVVSLAWGRIGAAVLLIISFGLRFFGYDMDEGTQATLFEVISNLLAGIALVQVAISKIRESKKVG